MSNAQQQATRRYRARRSGQGLKRIEVQIPASEAAVIRKAADILRTRAQDAAKLRRHLGFEPEQKRVRNAADIFSMAEPLTAKGETLWDQAMAKVEHDRKSVRLNRMRKVDM
jgi:hypothetical protein